MKKLKRLTTSLFISLIITSNAVAQEPYNWAPSCPETLSACDKALRDQIKVSDLQAAIIKDMANRYYLMDKQNNELREEVGAWYRNPFIIGGVSFGLGAILMGVLKK